MLKKKGVPHNVLNAKNNAREAEIVAQAGRLNAVTIATNMAGRGTDILLGGNPEYLAKQEMERNNYTHEQIEAATSYADGDGKRKGSKRFTAPFSTSTRLFATPKRKRCWKRAVCIS